MDASPGPARGSVPPPPAGKWDAVMALIQARVALVRLEAKDAASVGARRAVMVLLAIGCVFFGWCLLLAGIVAGIAALAGWPWYGVAIAVAALHIILAVILVKLAKSSASPTFTHTRAEFLKDREWLKNFQKTSNSND